MLRKIRRNYRRLMAFVLSVTMMISNMSVNVGTAFAAEKKEELEIALFMLDGKEILDAVRNLENQEEFDLEDLELEAAKKSVGKDYEELLNPKKGKVYELALTIDDEMAPEDTELLTLYRTETEEVVFLFVNESREAFDFCVNIDGYETKLVTVNANSVNVNDDEKATEGKAADGKAADGKAADKEATDKTDGEAQKADENKAAEDSGNEKHSGDSAKSSNSEHVDDSANGNDERISESEAQPEANEEEKESSANQDSTDKAEEGIDNRLEEGSEKDAENTLEKDSDKNEAVSDEGKDEGKKTETEKSDSGKSDSGKSDSEKPNGEKADEVKNDNAASENKDSGKAESHESENKDAGKSGDDKVENSKSEGDKSENSKPESSVSENSKSEDSKSEDSKSNDSKSDSKDSGKSNSEDSAGKELNISYHQAAFVAVPLEDIQGDNEELTESEPQEEVTEAVSERFEAAENESETEKANEVKPEATTAQESAEETAEPETEEETTANETAEETAAAETGEAAIEEESKEETTTAETNADTTAAETTAAETTTEAAENTAGTTEENRSAEKPSDSSKDDKEILDDEWEIPGKAYDGVTIWETARARAYCVELENVLKIMEFNGEEEIKPEEPPIISAKTYTAETEDAVFTVNVPEGAFEEEVELQVIKIENEQQLKELADQANDALEKKQTVSSLLAYDISFISQETGAEIEPAEAVSVSIQVKKPEMLTEDKETEAKGLSVMHLPENGDAEVVAATENVEETSFVFEAESFSIYVLAAVAEIDAAASIGEQYFATLQEAVNAVDAGNAEATILLEKDVTETIVSTEKSYTLDMQGHTVNGGNKGSVFTITNTNGGTVTLKNGTITGGNAVTGGGIRAVGTAKDAKNPFMLNVESCYIVGNTATGGYGGGVCLGETGNASVSTGGGSVVNGTWIDTEVSSNVGGGVHIKGVNTFKQQSMKPTIIISKNDLVFEHVTISNNSTQKSNAAAGLNVSQATLTAKECEISGNGQTSSGKAGGVFTNGYAEVSLSGGKIENNAANTVGGIYWEGGNITVDGTVIKGNMSAGKHSGVYLAGGAYSTFEMKSGAIYSNGGGNDIYINLTSKKTPIAAKIIAANAMQDPEMGENFFAKYEYTWTGLNLGAAISKSGKGATGTYQALAGKEPEKIAKIGNREFMSLNQAAAAVQTGETIELIPAGEGNSLISMLDTTVIEVNKEFTVDIKGINFSTQGTELFHITEGGKLTLSNTGTSGEKSTINGAITVDKGGILTVGAHVALASPVAYNGDSFIVNGEHEALKVSLGEGKVITAGEAFSVTNTLTIALDEKTLSSLNGNIAINDIVLIRESAKEEAEELTKKIIIQDLNYADKRVAVVVNEEGSIVLRKSDLSGIYLNGDMGDDSNNGLSSASPVKTFQKAAELLEAAPELTTIYVTGPVNVSENETWSLSSVPNGEVKRYETYLGTLANVTGTLTLRDITIDGAGRVEEAEKAQFGFEKPTDFVESTASLITVAKTGTLNISNGAILQNNRKKASRAMGGAVFNEGNLIMDGGSVQYNYAALGGGICSKHQFHLSGGTIKCNSTKANHGYKDYDRNSNYFANGGGVLVLDGVMTMTGGEISQNRTEGNLSHGGGISLGYHETGNAGNPNLVITNGLIQKNVAAAIGGGIYISNGEATIGTDGKTASNVEISYNDANAKHLMPSDNPIWAGGGIYVEVNAKLQLYNAEVAYNESGTGQGLYVGGAGIAACSTSKVDIYRIHGGVIHDNTYNGNNRDLHITKFPYGVTFPSDPELQKKMGPAVSISEYALGGIDNYWKYSNDELVPKKDLNQAHIRENINFHTDINPEDIQRSVNECNVHIVHNTSATQGGGIGANGKLIFGKPGGYLEVGKTVTGDEEAQDQEWEFTLTLLDGNKEPVNLQPGSDEDIDNGIFADTVPYTLKDNENKVLTTGSLALEKGKTSFVLKHGQKMLIQDLPAGTVYYLSENDANKNGFVTSIKGNEGSVFFRADTENNEIMEAAEDSEATKVNGVKGTIADNQTATAYFVNAKSNDLIISKTVIGDKDAEDEDWEFLVSLLDADGKPLTISQGTLDGLDDEILQETVAFELTTEGKEEPEKGTLALETTINHNGGVESKQIRFALKHNQAITIKNLPVGTIYHIEEINANAKMNGGEFVTKVSGSADSIAVEDDMDTTKVKGIEGRINAEEKAEVSFVNAKTGELAISKTVAGDEHPEQDEWEFELILQNAGGEHLNLGTGIYDGLDSEMQYCTLPYEITGKEMEHSETGSLALDEQGKARFMLKHGQTITIRDIPADLTYEITEVKANDGCTTGVIGSKDNTLIPDPKKPGKIKGVRGRIINAQAVNVNFVNVKSNTLSISKKVVGNAVDREWRFILTLLDAEGNPLTVNPGFTGAPDAAMQTVVVAFERISQGAEASESGSLALDKDGKAPFVLKHGQTLVLKDLPAGTKYKVIEENTEGYTASVNRGEVKDKDAVIGSEGVIKKDEGSVVVFTNTMDTGSLSVQKTVTGAKGDKTKAFTFHIVLRNPDGDALSGSYSYAGAAVSGMTDIDVPKAGVLTLDEKGEAVIRLKHGQKIIIEDLPVGTIYQVSEEEADKDGYTTKVDGDGTKNGIAEGSIEKDMTKRAEFVNDKPDEEKPTEPETPTEPEQPTEPEKPTEPEQPTEPERPTQPDTPNPPRRPSNPRRDIPNEPTPRTSIPDEPTPQTSIPDEPTPLDTIIEEEVPLAGLPNEPVKEVIIDDEIPLFGLPKTSDNRHMGLWMALFGLSGMGILLTMAGRKKRKEDE